MFHEILIPMVAVGLAELGDKTQLAVLCLASKTKQYFRLMLGVILAFVIADGLAIVLGDFLTTKIPQDYIKIGAGIMFLIFGIITLINGKDDEESCKMGNPFMSGFGLVFVSEMGDKTQIASGLFATQYGMIPVLIGVMISMTLLSILAIFLGREAIKRFKPSTLSKVAGIIFVVMGILTLVS